MSLLNNDGPLSDNSRRIIVVILLLGGFAAFASAPIAAQEVSREQDIVNLRLGQRVKVDDGSCPAGQIKQISGTKMTPVGVARTAKCVPRVAVKTTPSK